MQRSRRLNVIVSSVAERGEVRVSELVTLLDVSGPTVRRDLEYLEGQRLISRTHGGARTHTAFNDVPLGFKTAQDLAEKRRIARRALDFLDGVNVLGLTGGTTVTEFARLYKDIGKAAVVTNAVNVAVELVSNPRLRVFIAGGEVRHSSQETVGRSAEVGLAAYNIDLALIGVDGIDAQAGVTTYDVAGALVNSALQQRSRTTVILADATKVGRVALARVCDLSDVDVVITDDRATPEQVEPLRRAGCRVITV